MFKNFSEKAKRITLGILIVVLAILMFLGGYRYHAYTHPIPNTTHDTILVWDTIYHDIHHYHQKIDTVLYPDSVLIPIDVDTNAILKDYFAIYKYDRHWNDSTIEVLLSDTITQNKIEGSNFLKYKLLKPQTTIINNITNMTTYKSYINLGINTDYKFQHSILELKLIGPKYSVGAGYGIQDKTLFLNAGVNIIQLK